MNYAFDYPVPKKYDLEKDYYAKGVIRKKDLVDKKSYSGLSRNTGTAIWSSKEDCFIYDSYKFGMVNRGYIDHIEDDDGFDIFVPLYEMKEEEIKPIEEFRELKELIDSLDNVVKILNTPLLNQFHIGRIKAIFPQKINEFKKVFVKLTGEDPWEFPYE